MQTKEELETQERAGNRHRKGKRHMTDVRTQTHKLTHIKGLLTRSNTGEHRKRKRQEVESHDNTLEDISV